MKTLTGSADERALLWTLLYGVSYVAMAHAGRGVRGVEWIDERAKAAADRMMQTIVEKDEARAKP